MGVLSSARVLWWPGSCSALANPDTLQRDKPLQATSKLCPCGLPQGLPEEKLIQAVGHCQVNLLHAAHPGCKALLSALASES